MFLQAERVYEERQLGRLEYLRGDLQAASKCASYVFCDFESRCCVLFTRGFPKQVKGPS